MIADEEPLTSLPGVGAFIDKKIRQWVEQPPAAVEAPELRQLFLTTAEARRRLRAKPAWVKSYCGDLHMHTQWSDGSGSVSDMAAAGIARGYEYIAIADHSKGLKIARGIDERKLRDQGEEIAAVNEQCAGEFRVLRCLEMNLNPAGEGDMDADALAELDLVIGSFHSALRQTIDQTARYLAAIENPDIQILGHPRGRVYDYRIGLRADWRRVFARAAELDKAVELDCYPDRQDISADLLEIARAEGVRISIDTDAHAPEQLGFVDLGLAAALVAKISRERIINFMPAECVVAWAASVRARSAAVA